MQEINYKDKLFKEAIEFIRDLDTCTKNCEGCLDRQSCKNYTGRVLRNRYTLSIWYNNFERGYKTMAD